MAGYWFEDGSRVALAVTGKDRVSWLNGLLTCDVPKAVEGGWGAYGLACSKTGRVLADVWVLPAADHVRLSIPRATEATLRAHFDHYLVMEDVEVGPAEPALASVLAFDVATAAGWELNGFAAVERCGVVRAIVAAGGALQDDALAQATRLDPLEWERFRRERGVPSFGTDFGEATYPQEAGLERHAVSFSKGCYLGQEVVCMLEMRGQVKRKLVQLTFEDGEGDAALSSTQASAIGRGAKVYVEATGDAVLGEVTSAPIAAAPIGFAMVKRQAAEPGTRVWVECSGRAEPIAARVTAVL